MNIPIFSHISKSSRSLQGVVVLCLLFSSAGSACSTPPATDVQTAEVEFTSTSAPALTIITGGPCEMAPGETMPLGVSGMPGSDVSYSWTASAGNVNPPDNAAVTYTAPDKPGEVIIRVVAEKGDVASEAMVACQVIGPTQTPANTEVPTPTLTPTPSPTPWECTSYRSTKLQSADIPGQVTINTPAQGASDISSGQRVQVAGSHTGIPEGKYLWVFIYSANAGLHGRYYPQTKDALKGWQPEPTTGEDGLWTVDVGFGAPNLCYEVIVLVADAEASQSIANQLKAWADLDNFGGYELNGPETAIPPDGPGFPDGLVEKASIEVKIR